MSAARPRLLPGENNITERVAVLESEMDGVKSALTDLKAQVRTMEARMYVFNGIFITVVWFLNRAH